VSLTDALRKRGRICANLTKNEFTAEKAWIQAQIKDGVPGSKAGLRAVRSVIDMPHLQAPSLD